ncbi:MAG: hypothetical protein QXM52_00100 [Candidatus Bathyarchaeia archaeon]
MEKVYVALVVMVTLALIVGILGILNKSSNSQAIRESFENGFGEWSADADVPPDPNNPSYPVEWHVNRVTNVPRSGQYSLKFFIDGRQNEGTVWIEKKINVKKHTQIQVKVSFWLYSEQESFNTIAIVCAYLGAENPEVEEDFTVIGATNEVAGWKNYTHVVDLNTGSSGEIWVAVGISVRWETQMTYYIDDIEVEVR